MVEIEKEVFQWDRSFRRSNFPLVKTDKELFLLVKTDKKTVPIGQDRQRTVPIGQDR